MKRIAFLELKDGMPAHKSDELKRLVEDALGHAVIVLHGARLTIVDVPDAKAPAAAEPSE